MATRPASVSSNDSRRARSPAARRASATWVVSVISTIISLPTPDHLLRALPGMRLELEFVAEPLGAAEPEPQPASRGVAVGQRQLDVGDAGTLILEDEAHALAQPFLHDLQPHR